MGESEKVKERSFSTEAGKQASLLSLLEFERTSESGSDYY